MSTDQTHDDGNSNSQMQLNATTRQQEDEILLQVYDLLNTELFNLNVEISLLEIELSAYHNRMDQFKQQQQETKQLLCSHSDETNYLTDIIAEEAANSQEQDQLLADKVEFAQQFAAFKQHQEKKLDELQDMLHQSQFDFIASVTSMQTCIEDLKYTTTHISNYLVQSAESPIELKGEEKYMP